jgi:signal peptidase I
VIELDIGAASTGPRTAGNLPRMPAPEPEQPDGAATVQSPTPGADGTGLESDAAVAVAGDPPSSAGQPPGPTGPDEGQAADVPGQPEDEPRPRWRRWAVEGGVIVVLAVVVAVLLRVFAFQVFYVPSTSMLPTLHPGDRIVVDKLSYHLHPIERGDIIVFQRPADEHCGGPPVPDLVKRVIGLPGERISSRGNTVLINGKPIAQPWLPKDTQLGPPIPPTVVPSNSYYVLGDNRSDSCDSRYWGPVPRSLIVGKVVAIVWPLSRFHFF